MNGRVLGAKKDAGIAPDLDGVGQGPVGSWDAIYHLFMHLRARSGLDAATPRS